MFDSLVAGVVSGIVSSTIIYILIFQIKPKIKISDKIARELQETSCNILKIKVINKTRFAIFNLSYSLHYCHKRTDGIIDIIEIPPAKTSLLYISPNKRNDYDDKHAVRISYEVDENKYPLNEDSYFCFTIISTHGFTNTSSYIEKNYYKDDIINGVFETGNSLKVIAIQ